MASTPSGSAATWSSSSARPWRANWPTALDLYRGDLLEGFFIRGAPEFEQWLEDERARLKPCLAERTVAGGAK